MSPAHFSPRLTCALSCLRPRVEQEMQRRGLQLLSCHNNAQVWREFLQAAGWKNVEKQQGIAILAKPIWHPAFGQWMTEIPHTWLTIRDIDGRTKIFDGSAAQFQGQPAKYVKKSS
jgi:hypothetical protein